MDILALGSVQTLPAEKTFLPCWKGNGQMEFLCIIYFSILNCPPVMRIYPPADKVRDNTVLCYSTDRAGKIGCIMLSVRANWMGNLNSAKKYKLHWYSQWRPGEIRTGAINHSRGVLHGSYKKSLLWGVPRGLFCMVKMRYFRATGMIFPRLALLLIEFEGMRELFCNWKWIKWFRMLF
jgi:hypothetical protein